MANQSTYEIVTQRVIQQIESEGVLPWHKPWHCATVNVKPSNLISKKAYRGVNAFLLAMLNRENPYYVTYKQAKDLGGYIKKGEKGIPIVFWKMYNTKDKVTQEDVEVPVLRYSTVFNLEQCEGITCPPYATEEKTFNNEKIEKAEAVYQNMPLKPDLKITGDRAFYRPSGDFVQIPELKYFETAAEYYSALFHELGHSTGAKHRLNREGITDFHMYGDAVYSKEELIAELTSCFICSEIGIERKESFNNSVSYINGWLSALRRDSKLIVQAATQAQKATDYIFYRHLENKEEDLAEA